MARPRFRSSGCLASATRGQTVRVLLHKDTHDAPRRASRSCSHSCSHSYRRSYARHGPRAAITKLMYANFKGTLDTKTVNTDLSSHGPYSVRAPPVDMGITEHKHDEQTEYPGSDVDVPFIGLTVVAVRDPYKWIESMSYEIYGGQARNKFKVGQNETYSDAMERFLNTSWVGGDHVFNTSYEDIFDMRYRKVCNHIASALKYSQHVLFLRHEDDVSVTSKLSVVEAVSRLGWPLNADNGDVDLLLGKYYGHSEKNTNWGTGKGSSGENELIEAVNRHADWAFERVLGYLKQTPARVSSKPVTAASVPPRASVARAVVTPVPQPSPTPPEDTVKVEATPGPGADVAAGPLAR